MSDEDMDLLPRPDRGPVRGARPDLIADDEDGNDGDPLGLR
jgi:hypothetical protein